MYRLLEVSILLLPIYSMAATVTNAPVVNQRDFDSSGVEKIVVQNSRGKILIKNSASTKISVKTTQQDLLTTCLVKQQVTEFSELVAAIENPAGKDCTIDFEITTPADMDVSVTSGSGQVEVLGLKGTLLVNSGSGPVKASGDFNKIDLKSGSGNVEVTGLTGSGSISMGTGKLNLKLAQNPKGTLDIRSGMASTVIMVPKTVKINSQLNTGFGGLEIDKEIITSDSAQFGLRVSSGAGNVKIKAY